MPEETTSKDIARTAGEPLDTEAAARLIGVSKSWLEKSRVQGEGPRFHKIGARVVYYRADLETWLVTKGKTSTAEYEPKPRRSTRVKPAQPQEPEPIPAEAALLAKCPTPADVRRALDFAAVSSLEAALRAKFRTPRDALRALGLDESLLNDRNSRPTFGSTIGSLPSIPQPKTISERIWESWEMSNGHRRVSVAAST
jgi:predicted DNA-binding transcriptional regulator AlpA